MKARHSFVYHKRVKLGGKVEGKYEKEEYKHSKTELEEDRCRDRKRQEINIEKLKVE